MSKFPSYTEMCFRPVLRPNLPLEWLTKVTLPEYNRWAQSEMECPSLAGCPIITKLKSLERQRLLREKLYQIELKKIGDGLQTFDMVATPSNKDAVFNGVAQNPDLIKLDGVLKADQFIRIEEDPLHVVMDDVEKALNGRSYPENWMTGGYEPKKKSYPDCIKWDKYEKLTKRIMRDNGY